MGTEYIQTLLEYRSGDAYDFAADIIGMAAGGLVTAVYILSKKYCYKSIQKGKTGKRAYYAHLYHSEYIIILATEKVNRAPLFFTP